MQNQPNQTLLQKPVLPVNEAMAHLGFVNEMHKQLLQYKAGQQPQQQAPAAPQRPQNAPGQGLEPKGHEEAESKKMDDLEAKIDKKLEVLRDELKGHQKIEVESLRQMISDALENEHEPTE